jgi:hypothetical protein
LGSAKFILVILGSATIKRLKNTAPGGYLGGISIFCPMKKLGLIQGKKSGLKIGFFNFKVRH